jgi:uncharacterized protein GlcG (DUF336 family)
MDGVPQVALRGDGATIHTGESSFEKAFTVVTLGPIFDFDTSGEFFDLVKTNPFALRLAIASDAKIDARTEFQTGTICAENGGYMGNVG